MEQRAWGEGLTVPCPLPRATCYSDLSDFTGFVNAALID